MVAVPVAKKCTTPVSTPSAFVEPLFLQLTTKMRRVVGRLGAVSRLPASRQRGKDVANRRSGRLTIDAPLTFHRELTSQR